MGLESLQSLKNVHLVVSSLPSSCKSPVHASFYSLSPVRREGNQGLAYRVDHRSTLFGSFSNIKSYGLKRSCSAGFNEFFDDEFSNISSCNKGNNSGNMDSSMSFLPSKLEFLEPNLLGIQPEPPEWPERDEIIRISIERKANSVAIPLSLRMIKRKQKKQERLVDAGEFAYCSARKAFSSLVFIIRELQIHALQIRENLYSEDLQKVVDKVQMELNSSFVWLFQQVFSRTPTLMVYVMLLLANFTVHSMVTASPSPRTAHETITGVRLSTKLQTNSYWQLGRLSPSIRYPDVDADNTVDDYLPGNREMTQEEEMGLWKCVLQEASRMQAESRYKVLDHETTQQFVSSVTVKLEPDDYVEYHRTDLVYQMGVAEDPNNSLLLLNYAQFLYMVSRDYDRAEECFKRAIMEDPSDAEALSRYADFLWIVRKDMWNAEEKYQQAMATEPANHYHASKYANFLWNTGGEETCFPLDASNGNYNKVL